MNYIVENKYTTFVSENAQVGKGSIIRSGSIIEDNVVIGDNCIIGPYAHIHSGSKIGNECVIGNFVEVKNSILGKGCKAKHLVYLGDCECGENVNFGCGVVIANFDGKNKNTTLIKDNVFVGCNSNLIAPIVVGSNSFIAAGTTVGEEIQDNEFVIGRKKAIHKTNKLIG